MRLKLILVVLALVAQASATSFADLDNMARMEQLMEKDGYDVVWSGLTELHGDTIYAFMFDNHTGSAEIPMKAINDTFTAFAVLVNRGFSADGMAVMCLFDDGTFGGWYVSRELADRIWYAPVMPYEWFISQVLETYSVEAADF
jgi:hypothetical protein